MQVNIRIADNLYKKLRETAKEEHRTITAQLELILLNALETSDTDLTKNSIKPRSTISEIADNVSRNQIERRKDVYDKWN